jgi:hypothetical protein
VADRVAFASILSHPEVKAAESVEPSCAADVFLPDIPQFCLNFS